MSTEPKTAVIYLRVDPSVKNAFMSKAQRFDESPSEILRAMVVAFNEGRLTIEKPTTKKESIYNVP